MSEKTIASKTVAAKLRFLKTAGVAFFTIFLLLFWAAGCQHQWPHSPPDPNRLISRINGYYNALQTQAFTRMQLFYATRPSQTSSEPSALASKLSLKLASYEIQSLTAHETEAHVVMHLTIAGYEQNYDIMMIDHWQFIDNNWYVVDTVQPGTEENIEPLNEKIWQEGIQW